MAQGEWTARRVIVVAPSGTTVEAHVLVPSADDGSTAATVVPIAVMVVMLTISVFVPPVLLLNIPILIARAALTHTRREWQERVRFTALPCPACDAETRPADAQGTLPVTVPCTACGAALTVQPRPRVNLVQAPPD